MRQHPFVAGRVLGWRALLMGQKRRVRTMRSALRGESGRSREWLRVMCCRPRENGSSGANSNDVSEVTM